MRRAGRPVRVGKICFRRDVVRGFHFEAFLALCKATLSNGFVLLLLLLVLVLRKEDSTKKKAHSYSYVKENSKS